jgi:16S rRNA (uracil1498-N3)-methyltransferase
MQLFYHPEINETTDSFFFDKEESRHIVKVMRKSEGDTLFVTNALGFMFKCKVKLPSDNKCLMQVESFEKIATRNYALHMAVAPTKMNERFEWFLEKATEIGVTEITPLICDHSERKNIKSDRFEKIILSAMKQSIQCYLPKLNEAIPFSEFIKTSRPGTLCIAHCEETDRKSFKQILKPGLDLTVLIGPEGDFSNKEITLALQNNYIPVSLGSTRLRTETAAIAACHSAAFINETL